MKKFFFMTVIVIGLVGCTDNSRSKNFGGTSSIDLPTGQKLVNVTWKENQIWYLTRPMHEDESPETYAFKEKSSWGMIEGTVILKESK